MVNISFQTAINTLVVAKIPRFSGDKKFLKIELNMQYDYYSNDDRDENCYIVVELLYQRRHNYTKVLYNYRINGKRKFEYFQLESDHDSCWREVRFLNKIDTEAYEYFKSKGLSRNDISTYFSFDIDEPKIIFGELTKVNKKDDYNCDYNFVQTKSLSLFEEFEVETGFTPWYDYSKKFEEWYNKHKSYEGR
jgi:hypothetical protein